MVALHLGLPTVLSGGLVLTSLTVMTGAMHEDGLADTADGLWGGFDSARRLEIMKDSHLGTYGMLALLIVTGLRWNAYALLLPSGILPIIAAACLSRAAMPCVMATLPHARNTGLSRSVGRPSKRVAGTGLLIATAISGLILGPVAIMCLVAALSTAALVGWTALKKINGQTGDILGATQQLSEITILGMLATLLT